MVQWAHRGFSGGGLSSLSRSAWTGQRRRYPRGYRNDPGRRARYAGAPKRLARIGHPGDVLNVAILLHCGHWQPAISSEVEANNPVS